MPNPFLTELDALATPHLANPFSSFAAVDDARAQRPIEGLSHVRGGLQPPLVQLTVGQLLAHAVRTWGDREAFVFLEQRIRWTWKQFSAEVDRFAAGLLCLGVTAGDRVGIWSPNRSEWVLTQFATARIGAILVNVNPAYRIAELEYALKTVGVKVVVAAERFKSSDYLATLRSLLPELHEADAGALRAARVPTLRTVIRMGAARTPGMLNFDSVMQMAGPAQISRLSAVTGPLCATDAINIQFTSGTTGSPKGATLTHHNIVNNARFVAHAMRLGPADRLCIPVPLYHCFGMVLGVLACTASGACMVFPGEGFDPVATLGAVGTERCTAVHGVPTMFVAMLGLPDFRTFDLSSLRTGIMAGAPCPIETMKQVMSDMHMPEVTIAYGMTETSPVSFQSAVDDPIHRRVATVGRVQPHVEVKVVDDTGQCVPVGATGELWVRGYSVMRSYWAEPEKTRETVVDGWMRSGDLAVIDAQGYCNIVGRLKDMVIRGGENIYPREIEDFLYRLPGVAEVQVFGVPDLRFGEELACWIVPKPGAQLTEEGVRNFCRSQIAHFKVPRHVRLVDAMPMTVTGKPQKFLMRQTMVDELGLRSCR